MPRNKEKLNINKSLLVLTGFSCNNNCIVCSLKDRQEFYSDRTTEEIMKDMDVGIEKGFGAVEFTGGEPTIRKRYYRFGGLCQKSVLKLLP